MILLIKKRLQVQTLNGGESVSENKGEMMTHNIEKRINKLKTSGNPKFKKLDSDIHYLLKRFEGEKNHKGFYPKFKQGEIVFVDFGINVNKEFSNSHFAIVMNKNDSNTEDIVNVIPLSSKENKKYLKMNFDLKWEYYLRLFFKFNQRAK